MVAVPANDREVFRHVCLRHQRAVRRSYELNSREMLRKFVAKLALPIGVQVQVDLIYEYNGRHKKGIVTGGVIPQQSISYVREPRRHGLVPEAQIVERDLAVIYRMTMAARR
jgi:hypothetical protein